MHANASVTMVAGIEYFFVLDLYVRCDNFCHVRVWPFHIKNTEFALRLTRSVLSPS